MKFFNNVIKNVFNIIYGNDSDFSLLKSSTSKKLDINHQNNINLFNQNKYVDNFQHKNEGLFCEIEDEILICKDIESKETQEIKSSHLQDNKANNQKYTKTLSNVILENQLQNSEKSQIIIKLNTNQHNVSNNTKINNNTNQNNIKNQTQTIKINTDIKTKKEIKIKDYESNNAKTRPYFFNALDNKINIQKAFNLSRDVIKKFEGLSLKSYKCSAGVWTIGYGNTSYLKKFTNKSNVIINQEQADNLLNLDLEMFFQGVLKKVNAICNENQIAALTSFAFNIGMNAFNRSTLLKLVLHNANDFEKIKSEFIKWNKVNKDISTILTRRRNAEFLLYSKS